MQKRCSSCKETKPITDYNRNRSTKDGYHSQCRPCHVAASGKYKAKVRLAEKARKREARQQQPYLADRVATLEAQVQRLLQSLQAAATNTTET